MHFIDNLLEIVADEWFENGNHARIGADAIQQWIGPRLPMAAIHETGNRGVILHPENPVLMPPRCVMGHPFGISAIETAAQIGDFIGGNDDTQNRLALVVIFFHVAIVPALLERHRAVAASTLISRLSLRASSR